MVTEIKTYQIVKPALVEPELVEVWWRGEHLLAADSTMWLPDQAHSRLVVLLACPNLDPPVLLVQRAVNWSSQAIAMQIHSVQLMNWGSKTASPQASQIVFDLLLPMF